MRRLQVGWEMAVCKEMVTGLWKGEPGTMTMRNDPTDEVFTLIYGKFEITNEDDSVVVMNPGESALIRKGWSDSWRNVEKSCKCFTSDGDSEARVPH